MFVFTPSAASDSSSSETVPAALTMSRRWPYAPTMSLATAIALVKAPTMPVADL
jgi:hypothetical protein